MSCLITAKNVADAFRVVFDLVRMDWHSHGLVYDVPHSRIHPQKGVYR